MSHNRNNGIWQLLAYIWKMNNFAFSVVWILRVILLRTKCTAKFVDGVLPNFILHVEIMLRHIYISMSNDTLNS